jgi:hypothetical protein
MSGDDPLKLPIGGLSFTVYYQRGFIRDGEDWIADEKGSLHLVACECGAAVMGNSRGEAFEQLERSINFETPVGVCGHNHGPSAVPCNIIKAEQFGAGGWVMGKIVWYKKKEQ